MVVPANILHLWERKWGRLSDSDRDAFLRHPALPLFTAIPAVVTLRAFSRYRDLEDAAAWARNPDSDPPRRTATPKPTAWAKPASPRAQKGAKTPPPKPKRPRPPPDFRDEELLRLSKPPPQPFFGDAKRSWDPDGDYPDGHYPDLPHDADLHKKIGPTMKYDDDT